MTRKKKQPENPVFEIRGSEVFKALVVVYQTGETGRFFFDVTVLDKESEILFNEFKKAREEGL